MLPFLADENRKNLSPAAYGLLVLLCLLLFLPGFFSLPPIDRDEPHFAQATKQMLETSNYTDIRFQEEPRYKKPVGIYWLQAASVKLFSPNAIDAIWAYRVPSLIGATASVLFTAALGSLFFGPLTGLWAAILMGCCLVLNVEARLAKTDAFLLACVMAAQYAMARAFWAAQHPTEAFAAKRNALLFWTAQGIGFLIKGPIPLLISAATLLTLWRFDRRKTRMAWVKSLYPLSGFLYAALLAAPWFIAISLQSHGGFIQSSAGHDFLAKIWQGQDRGMVPPGVHLLALPIVFFPSSLLLLLALPDIWRERREPRVLFLLGWVALPWILFEASLTKLPHYVMPLYPALAILAAHALSENFPSLMTGAWRKTTAAIVGFWLCLAGGIVACLMLLSSFFNGDVPAYLVVGGFLVLSLFSGFLVALLTHPQKALLAIVAGSLVLNFIVFEALFPSLHKLWLSREIVVAARKENVCPVVSYAAAAYNEPSLVFDAGTKTRFFGSGESLAAAMKEDPCLLGVVSIKQKKSFLDAFEGKKPQEIATIEGFNLGGGRKAELTLYRSSGDQK
jgi:4-amino-4-deoxy-L-arabinose transferase-like glycosyltransferase